MLVSIALLWKDTSTFSTFDVCRTPIKNERTTTGHHCIRPPAIVHTVQNAHHREANVGPAPRACVKHVLPTISGCLPACGSGRSIFVAIFLNNPDLLEGHAKVIILDTISLGKLVSLKASSFVLSYLPSPLPQAPGLFSSLPEMRLTTYMSMNEVGKHCHRSLSAARVAYTRSRYGNQRRQVDLEMDNIHEVREKGFSTARSPTSSALTCWHWYTLVVQHNYTFCLVRLCLRQAALLVIPALPMGFGL